MTPHETQTIRARSVVFIRACLSAPLKLLLSAALATLAAGPCLADPPAKASYPNMAPREQYLMPRDAEIALARSAGPDSVSRDAEVLVLGPHGFERAVPGHNGFVCIVLRSWSSPIDDAEFWNPHERGPICYNAAAARYYVPLLNKKTALVLAGKSKAEITTAIQAALTAREIPPLEAGAMCFMLAKGGHLNDGVGHWHPHLMFFAATDPATWGANLSGSPIVADTDALDHITTFMVPVRRWSDGASDAH